MKKQKFFFPALSFFIIGNVCVLAFKLIGSSVDANGVLHEPFALIPIAYIAFFLALIFGLLAVLNRFRK
ncbi:DUF3955 domain-containing protein [Candidatus Peregrinibacteria bacterium]|nr:DUF3955 domain-containing protein [Candidatus Peregrinibacteria bacterium]